LDEKGGEWFSIKPIGMERGERTRLKISTPDCLALLKYLRLL
jgi:hypothetical protein